MDMNELKRRLIESIIHSVIIMLISLLLQNVVITIISNIFLESVCFFIGIAILAVIIKKPYKRESLMLDSWIALICVIFIGNFIGEVIPISSLITCGFAFSVFDIVSFTKLGEKTTNAKVMANRNLMWKLIVYGKSFKNKDLVPTKGVGDFLFYTLLLSGLYKFSNNELYLFYGECLIFLGCSINWIIVCCIYKNKNYKGFPATFIPFLMIFPLILRFVF